MVRQPNMCVHHGAFWSVHQTSSNHVIKSLHQITSSNHFIKSLHQIWWKETLHLGKLSCLLCSLIKNRESEAPPRRTWNKFLEGGLLTHGSWWGNKVNRKHPRGGGFLSIKSLHQVVPTAVSKRRCNKSVCISPSTPQVVLLRCGYD